MKTEIKKSSEFVLRELKKIEDYLSNHKSKHQYYKERLDLNREMRNLKSLFEKIALKG